MDWSGRLDAIDDAAGKTSDTRWSVRIAFNISFCWLLPFPKNELTNSMVSFKLVCCAGGEVVVCGGNGEVVVCGGNGKVVVCSGNGEVVVYSGNGEVIVCGGNGEVVAVCCGCEEVVVCGGSREVAVVCCGYGRAFAFLLQEHEHHWWSCQLD